VVDALEMAVWRRRPVADLSCIIPIVKIQVGVNGRPDPHSDRLQLDAFPRNCRSFVTPGVRAGDCVT
jgi:hypothetical protein